MIDPLNKPISPRALLSLCLWRSGVTDWWAHKRKDYARAWRKNNVITWSQAVQTFHEVYPYPDGINAYHTIKNSLEAAAIYDGLKHEVALALETKPGQQLKPAYEIAPSEAAVRAMRKRLNTLYPENARTIRPRVGVAVRSFFSFVLATDRQPETPSYPALYRDMKLKAGRDPIFWSALVQILEVAAEKDNHNLQEITGMATTPPKERVEILQAPLAALITANNDEARKTVLQTYSKFPSLEP